MNKIVVIPVQLGLVPQNRNYIAVSITILRKFWNYAINSFWTPILDFSFNCNNTDVNTEAIQDPIVNRRGLENFLNGDSDLPVLQRQTAEPTLGDYQVLQAISVVLEDYWEFHCRKSHLDVHSTFIYAYPTVVQRLYIVYMYYLYKIQSDTIFLSIFRNGLDEGCQRIRKSAVPTINLSGRTPVNRDTIFRTLRITTDNLGTIGLS